MSEQGNLFDDDRPSRKTRAPEELTERQRLRLAEWTARRVPWVLTGALECVETLGSFEDTCLSWYRARGRMGFDWVAAVQGWIWRDEKTRVFRLSPDRFPSARAALRNPEKWSRDYARAERMAPDPLADPDVIIPEGSNVISIHGGGSK